MSGGSRGALIGAGVVVVGMVAVMAGRMIFADGYRGEDVQSALTTAPRESALAVDTPSTPVDPNPSEGAGTGVPYAPPVESDDASVNSVPMTSAESICSPTDDDRVQWGRIKSAWAVEWTRRTGSTLPFSALTVAESIEESPERFREVLEWAKARCGAYPRRWAELENPPAALPVPPVASPPAPPSPRAYSAAPSALVIDAPESDMNPAPLAVHPQASGWWATDLTVCNNQSSSIKFAVVRTKGSFGLFSADRWVTEGFFELSPNDCRRFSFGAMQSMAQGYISILEQQEKRWVARDYAVAPEEKLDRPAVFSGAQRHFCWPETREGADPTAECQDRTRRVKLNVWFKRTGNTRNFTLTVHRDKLESEFGQVSLR